MSAPVPARSWPSTRAASFTLEVESTEAGDSEVQLWVGDPHTGASVLLDRAQTGELVTDLLCRLALIGGRYAAVRAAADSSIDHQRGPRPIDHAWSVTDSGRDALRGRESVVQRSPRVVDAVIYCGEHHPTLESTSCGREAEHDGLCRGIYPRTGVVRDWYAADAVVDGDDPVDREVLGTRARPDALRGPVITGTGTPGALTPPDPRSHDSVDGGGAR